MKIKVLYIVIVSVVLFSTHAFGQSTTPTINPSMSYTDSEGSEQTGSTSISESAPLTVNFTSGASDTDGWSSHYEWRFYKQGQRDNPYVVRYEENTSFTFTESGAHLVELWATFVNGTDTVSYTDEYWSSEATPLSVSIYESKLDFPNAFSPNGDGINDFFQAKTNTKSIVEFHAYIFNRHGQKLYDWTDWSTENRGWDGTHNGHPVKDGVYYVYVKARGADGMDYEIRRDVNLLRNFNTVDNTNP